MGGKQVGKHVDKIGPYIFLECFPLYAKSVNQKNCREMLPGLLKGETRNGSGALSYVRGARDSGLTYSSSQKKVPCLA